MVNLFFYQSAENAQNNKSLIMMQCQEIILEPLSDGQTMPKNGEIPIALHHTTPPYASYCLGVWNATLVVIFLVKACIDFNKMSLKLLRRRLSQAKIKFVSILFCHLQYRFFSWGALYILSFIYWLDFIILAGEIKYCCKSWICSNCFV